MTKKIASRPYYKDDPAMEVTLGLRLVLTFAQNKFNIYFNFN